MGAFVVPCFDRPGTTGGKVLTTVESVWVLQHNPIEGLGSIEDVLRARQIGFDYVETHRGKRVPRDMGGKAGLIVMGGSMGVYEQATYPFLRDELRLIESALQAEQPVLGVCLGSQLLASVLGADVTRGARKELGWYPVTLSEAAASDPLFAGINPSFWPFHWHGDVFPLPKQCVPLARSEQTECQAFRHGKNAYGLLFHMEVTRQQIARMLAEFADELHEAGGMKSAIDEETARYLPALQELAAQVLGRWASGLITV